MFDHTKITIYDVIQCLPLSDESKAQVKASYDSYPLGKKSELSDILWTAFDEMKQILTDESYEEILAEVESEKRPLMSDVADQARARAWEKINDLHSGKQAKIKADQDKLDTIRTQLATLT
jgi:hypothetical protein